MRAIKTTTAVSAESVEHAATNAQTVPTNTHDDSEEEDEEAIEVNEEDILTFATSLLEKFFRYLLHRIAISRYNKNKIINFF